MCCFKIQNGCSESFETRQGLRQGDVLSKLLFNVMQQRITTMSQSAVRDAYLALEIEAAKVGLKINEQKTKYMIAARNDRAIGDVGQSVAIGDKHFQVVKEFVYLGSLLTPTNDVSLEIQRRIQTANRCFFGLGKHLQLTFHARQNSPFTRP
jgi:hypothetical protein